MEAWRTLLQGGNIDEFVAEDPNEHNQDNESEKSDKKSSASKEQKPKNQSDNSLVINVNMGQEQGDASNINVKLNIDDASSKMNTKRSNENEENSKQNINEISHSNSQRRDSQGSHSNNSDEDDANESRQINEIRQSKFEDIFDYYAKLREIHNSQNPWRDTDFGMADINSFINEDESIEFTRIKFEKNQEIKFLTFEESSNKVNISYEFKIQRGRLKDRFFLGAMLMLFRRREQFFENWIVDYEHIKDNLEAGFVGFTFFINGEWRVITVDTLIPTHQNEEYTLSNTESAYWMCLFEKAYAKAFDSYQVLNGELVIDYLVDLTGGWARCTDFICQKDQGMEENKKKKLYEDIRKALSQKYLIGCLFYNEDKWEENLDDSQSDDGADDEAIAANCMHNILDAQEDGSTRLIYLVNYWPKGKWTGHYSVEDETWEANKALAARLNYQVSQSDGTFWMDFDDWLKNFNRIYYCRIFPESWSQFCIEGKWTSVSSGGAPPRTPVWLPEKVNTEKLKEGGGFSGGPENAGSQSKADRAGSIFNSPSVKFDSKRKTGIAAGKSSITHPMKTPIKSPWIGIMEEGAHSKYPVGSSLTKPFLQSKNLQGKTGTKTMIGATPSMAYSIKKTNTGISNISETKQQQINKINKVNEENAELRKKKQNPRIIDKDLLKRQIKIDTEDRWFLNPQYKIELTPNTRMIISLMQEDKKLQNNNYLKCSILVIHSKGRYSRIWDWDEDKVVKRISDEGNSRNHREIILQWEYSETLKHINKDSKKKLQRGEPIHLNLIPYIDYYEKYDMIQGKNIEFTTHSIEAVFWLRIFASSHIYLSELPRPYESSVQSKWNKDTKTAGGARYIIEKNKTLENPKWPTNPQYWITFDRNIQMKIILKKTVGVFPNHQSKIGFILTKPEPQEVECITLKQKTATTSFGRNPETTFGLKNEQISRVMDMTARILDNRRRSIDDIFPKLFINGSEWVIESSYCSTYCASIYLTFNKIDSPLIIIPTLETPDSPYGFELKIYSNRPTNIFPWNTEECQWFYDEWGPETCGGCHLSQDEKKEKVKSEDTYTLGSLQKKMSWYNNPKFNWSFPGNTKLPSVEFEIVLTRLDNIWKPIIAKGVINSMIGVYWFKMDENTKWRNQLINLKEVEFLPQNQISMKFELNNVDPRGFIIMPVTYGSGVKGPFIIMVKCKTKFFFTQIDKEFT